MRAGARGYLLKGAEQDEIADAIRAVVRGQAIFGAAIASRLLDHFANPPAAAPDDPSPELTPREKEILVLLAQARQFQAYRRARVEIRFIIHGVNPKPPM